MLADPAAPILLFDSGVGGLTILSEIRKVLPDAPIIYAADLAGLPYGPKTEAEVAARVCGLLGRMAERYQPRLACIACNTASTIALEMVRDVLEIPIVGTVPAIKPAAAMTRTGTIGLLGTEATIRQGYVDRLEARFADGKRLLRHGAPALVELAEARLRGREIALADVEAAVAGLRQKAGGDEIDTIVLACTHFPLLEPELSRIFGPGVRFVNGAQGIAAQVARLVEGRDFGHDGPDRFIATGPLAHARELAPALEPYGLIDISAF